MKLVNLHIARFGARSELTLDELSEGVNVIYGPNGSGKTTIINFVRWILYGNRSESTQFLRAGGAASGKIVIRDDLGLHTLERREPTAIVDQGSLSGFGHHPSAPPCSDVSLREFNDVFCFGFDHVPEISRLIETATARGFHLEHDERQLHRIRQLSDEVVARRAELNSLPFSEATADALQRRHAEKNNEIQRILLEHDQRRTELERNRVATANQVAEKKREIERHRDLVDHLDAAIQERRQWAADDERLWQEARQVTVDRRQHKLAEIESQIHLWQETLQRIRQRLDEVRSYMSSVGEIGTPGTDEATLHYFLKKLGFRVYDLEQDAAPRDVDGWRDHEVDSQDWRGLVNTALTAMRDDLSRLCSTCDQQQQTAEARDYREELDHLSRCEQELAKLVDRLAQRQQELSRTLTTEPLSSLAAEYSSSAGESTVPLATFAAVKGFRLQQMAARSDMVQGRLREAEFEMAELERRLEALDSQRSALTDDGRISVLRQDIKHVEAELRALERREVVQRQIDVLEDEIRRLRGQLRQGEIVEEASAILRRVTCGAYTRIHLSPTHKVLVEDRDAQKVDYRQLSRGTYDELYLSLSLALADAYRRRRTELPIILHDTFVNIDTSGATAIAQILHEFATRGHQVLVFSRHEHILELFRSRESRLFSLRQRTNGDVRSLRNPSYQQAFPDWQPTKEQLAPPPFRPHHDVPPVAEAPPPVAPEPTYRWVAEWHRRAETAPARPPSRPSSPDTNDESHTKDTLPVSHARPVDEDSPLASVPTLDRELIEYLTEIGIHQVGQFLDLSPNEAESRLHRYGVQADVIERRQREALLQCYVGISPDESRLLVACGVPDPERLARADEAVLHHRIQTILQRAEARERFGTLAVYDLPRIRGWIHAAANSRRRDSQSSPRTIKGHPTSRRANRGTGNDGMSDAAAHVVRDGQQRRAARQTTVPIRESRPLRFFLETSDAVVDAPSIGPKTAEKLHEIGIRTVKDLLDADAETASQELGDRRIGPETIHTWQLQARLVCRVPNLRGHDAQILVACDILDPQALAEQNVERLHKQVTQFVNSNEGKRVLRNGKRPDLAEVRNWIEWAESARQLRAA